MQKTSRNAGLFTLTLLAVLFANTNLAKAQQANVACPAGYICTKIVTNTPAPVLDTLSTNINMDGIWTTGSKVPPCHIFNTNLSVSDFSNNSLGKELIALQKYLISSGYKDVILSGRFDERTKTAVMAYQSKSGIPSTGFVGPLTRATLNGAVCSNQMKGATPTVSTTPVEVAPRINSISRSNVRYNDTVTLRGTNFSGVRSELLYITDANGSISPEILSSSATRVVFKVPNVPTGTYDVYLTSNTGTSNKVQMRVSVQAVTTTVVETSPRISSISKSNVKYNDIVTLRGTNFSGVRSELLYITDSKGSISPELISSSPTAIDFKVPNVPAGTYDVYLTSNTGTSNKVQMSVSVPVVVPTITNVSKTSAKYNDLITIRGYGFKGVTSELLYITNVGGSISPTLVSTPTDTAIVFRTPNVPAGDYQIYLTADGGISNKVPFAVYIPTVTAPIE